MEAAFVKLQGWLRIFFQKFKLLVDSIHFQIFLAILEKDIFFVQLSFQLCDVLQFNLWVEEV